MSDIVLTGMIDAWLRGSWRTAVLRFPAELEARFEAETGLARNRVLMAAGSVSLAIAGAFYFALLAMLPDVASDTARIYLATLPVGLAAILLMLLDPAPALRESAFLVANTATVCACLYVFSLSHQADAAVFVALFGVLIVGSAMGAQLRFPYALASTLIIVCGFAAAVNMQLAMAGTARLALTFSAICLAGYGLLGNWRLELEQRRAYLLSLRDRLQMNEAIHRTLELDELTRRDPLTGLANRRAYEIWLANMWSQEALREGRVGLVVLDIDRFKEYNDYSGHDAGDHVLKKVAVCLRDQLRGTSDQIARLSGASFAVLLPGLNEEICADVAERLRSAVQRMELPHLGIGLHGLVSVSAGVASHVAVPGTAASALYQAADTALYQAKIFGRNRVCIATLATPAVLSAPVAG